MITKPKTERFPKIAGNDQMDVHIARKPSFAEGPPANQLLHHRVMPDNRARFAMTCIERWAMVAAIPDGEDSAGRQRVRRMTATEVVAEACKVSEEADREFRARGWLVDMPSLGASIDAIKDVENGND